VALPLVVVVSLINQQLWQGRGSNPLLSLALEEDQVALAIFFFTAAIAAPLLRNSCSGAFVTIVDSLLAGGVSCGSSDICCCSPEPFRNSAADGVGDGVGVVYTRSRNLLAPMLLHSLWNSGTLLSLFILGSGSS